MRKIWNRPNQAIWSLSTVDTEGIGNMNICTYVNAVSMEPKFMMVALYHGTKTHENVVVTKRALLQLLTEDLALVTRVCGHTSGYQGNKIKRLQKKYEIHTSTGLPYFTGAAGYLELQLEKIVSVGGDHDLGIFSVVLHRNLNDTPLLTTEYLRTHGLLR